MCELERPPDPEDTNRAERADGHDHGLQGFSHTSDGTRRNMENGDDPVERIHIFHHVDAVIDDCLLACKDPDNIGSKDQHQSACHDSIDGAHADGNLHPLVHPVELPRAVVLAGKGGSRHAHAQNRQQNETVNFVECRIGGHYGSAEAVDPGLNHHVGQGDDDILYPCWQTDFDDLS